MLFLQLLVNGAINAAGYALLAVGFGIIYRAMRFFHIAFGASYIVAAFSVVALIPYVPVPVAVIVGLFFAACSGGLMEILIFSPLRSRGASGEVLLIASLGLYIVIVNTIALFFGNEVHILSHGISPSLGGGQLSLTMFQIVQFLVGWFVVLLVWFAIRRNTFFMGLWALGETPELITALGFPVRRMRVVAFSGGAILAGCASLLTAYDIGVDPQVGMSALMVGAVAVLVGGAGRYWGWVGGATVLAFLQALAVWQFSSRWNDLITFGVLVLTLSFRPDGLFAVRGRREEK